jgi:hypothetical protein
MGKLDESKLRRAIKSEAAKVLLESSRRNRLVDLIFEEDEVLQGFDISKGPSAAIAFLNGPGADKRVRALLAAGKEDGDEGDEAATVNEGSSATVGELVPTQVEIELTKSIAYPLASFEELKKMTSPGVHSIGPEGNNKIVTSGNLIIDGHHRWSSLFSITGPEGVIASVDIALPETDAKSVLAIVQTAIAATTPGPVPKAKAGGMNILGKGKAALIQLITSAVGTTGEKGEILSREFVISCMKDEEVQKCFGIPRDLASKANGLETMKDAEEKAEKKKQTESYRFSSSLTEARGNRIESAINKVRGIIIDKVADNLSQMNKPAEGSPPRVDMPQLDKAGKGVKGVFDALKSGEVNYKAPYGDTSAPAQAAESRQTRGDIIMERWQKLAGLIK